MNKEQVESWLRQLCDGKDWFHSVGWDQFGRAVVYVKYMDGEVLRFVPDYTEDGKQVLTHFAASATINKGQFLNKPETNGLAALVQSTTDAILKKANMTLAQTGIAPGELTTNGAPTSTLSPEEEERLMEMQVQALTKELDRLERLCGPGVLSDIFFEIHDGPNAVTNLSAKFPEVRQRMEKLYNKYGFDIIYDELEL